MKLDDTSYEWDEDSSYPNVQSLKVHNIHIPEEFHHWFKDPAGLKSARDKRIIARMQKWQTRERLKKYKDPSTMSNEPTRQQSRLGEAIREALNQIIIEDISSATDPKFQNKNAIVSPVIQIASARFVEVVVTRDLLTAKCYWECKPSYETQVRDQFALIKSDMRKIIAERVRMKFIPKLDFRYNENKVSVQETERILDDVSGEDKKIDAQETFADTTAKLDYFQQILDEYEAKYANNYNPTPNGPRKKKSTRRDD
eukprot:TRINITY_DN4386_c0_g1_i2.p1 TRINITY_DN4386_c0_g1~~TRINITY_DN4386_c0_g1_i2.p1  ORF type:complete len:297 (+),score=43.11 TRINITY_DN4386_c0_g1_i2:126-893(+)